MKKFNSKIIYIKQESIAGFLSEVGTTIPFVSPTGISDRESARGGRLPEVFFAKAELLKGVETIKISVCEKTAETREDVVTILTYEVEPYDDWSVKVVKTDASVSV